MIGPESWPAGEMPIEDCTACGHYVVEHLHHTWQCQVDVLGLNNEWRRCTCTFVRLPATAGSDRA